MGEDRLGVTEVIDQQQQRQQPREEPEAVAKPPEDDESRAAAVLDVIFNDTSSESNSEGFASAEVKALMMPMIGARVDSSEGRGDQPRMSSIRSLTKLLLMAWMKTVA